MAWSRAAQRPLVLVLFLAGAFLQLGAQAASAEDRDKDAKRCLVIGLNVAGMSFQGDLDGRLTLWHFDKAYFLPVLAQETLVGLSFGQQWAHGAWAIGFSRASRLASLSAGRSGAVSLSLLEVRGKTLLFKASPVHPCFFLGFGLPWMRVENGAQLGGRVEEASYVGLGVVLGGGAQLDLGPLLFLEAGVSYRSLWLLYAWGGGRGRDISRLVSDQSGAQMRRPLQATGLSWEASLGVKLF